jgi:pSer/pThr/pTyr-binding forkhead associated (FHA) protein
MRAQLIPLDGGPPIEIERDLIIVGRKEDCDLRLDHKGVSKMHCVIVKTDGLLLLRDLGSTNGTRVNGQRVRRAALLPNDRLAFGSLHFRVYLGPDDTSRTEHTQPVSPAELARARHSDAGSSRSPLPPAQPNALPDVYPEHEPHSSSR